MISHKKIIENFIQIYKFLLYIIFQNSNIA